MSTRGAGDAPARSTPHGPLAGVRVLDLSRVLAGPFCGSLLADLGADVIRVEHPTKQDEVRAWAPVKNGLSATYAAVNHSKRGLALDLASADGVAVFRRLLATADVLVENFRPGTLDRMGLTREALRGVNPKLVHCAIRAFPAGTSGEDLPGYEASMQAYSGIMSVTGEHEGDPVRCGVSVVDLGTGMASTIAVLAALRERDRTGQGQYVEPALLRTATNLLNYQIAGYSLGAHPQRYGSGHELLVPYRNFQCADGTVLIAAGNDRLWARLAGVLQLREASGALPFPTLALRVANRARVNEMIAAAVQGRTREDLLQALKAAGIPCAPVNTVAEYVSDASLEKAGVLDRVRIPEVEEALLAGALFGADFLPKNRRAPPKTGQHTSELLTAIGYSAEEIEALRANGVVS
ncbi:MAG TPA: CaiB/BaiF CoA-transferase family protein [Burkholderiales bacterium]|nr:CaiB/BaiF CoA-transferase family protein [Burkholderiales bacterium]